MGVLEGDDMSTTAAKPTPSVATRTRGVWRGRVALAAAAGLIAGAVGWFTFSGAPYTGRIVVQTRSYNPIAAPAATSDGDLTRMQVELLLRRSFIERIVAEPAIITLPTIREQAEPVNHLEANLRVTELERGRVEISLTGEKGVDLIAILDLLAKMHIEDVTIADRKHRDETLRKLEALIQRYRDEIQSRERAINLMIEANGPVSGNFGEDLARISSEVRKTEQEVEELNLQIGRAKKAEEIESLKDKRDTAIAILATRKQFRELFEKGGRQAERSRADADKLFAELNVPREALHTLERRQIDLQIERELGPTVVIREPAVAIRNEDLRQRALRSAMFFSAAFASAFLLGFGLFRAAKCDQTAATTASPI